MRLVEPAAVVAHEVAHSAVPGRGVQEGERAVEDRRPGALVAAARKRQRDDGEPCDVVDAVAAVAVRNDPVRVLDDADVVDEREHMIVPEARQVQLCRACRAAAWSELGCLLQHRRGGLRDRRPGERRRDVSCLGPGRRQRVRVIEVTVDRRRNRCRDRRTARACRRPRRACPARTSTGSR